MAFYARTFIFDGIPSEFYDLYIGEFGGTGDSTSDGSNDVELLTEKLFRRPSPLFFGAEQDPVLDFSLSAYFQRELSAQEYSGVSKWLFGQQKYKVLRICQEDMQQVYFNAFLTAPSIRRIGNMIQGFEAKVICDAPWGWRDSKTYPYVFSDDSVYATTKLFNESTNSFYTYPTTLYFKANLFGGTVKITNLTDDPNELRPMIQINLLPNEQITMNCDLQFIASTLSYYPLQNFNKNWLRFVPGLNNLKIEGSLLELAIVSPIAVKVG